MPDKIFFDTNILVYLSNEDSPFHAKIQDEFSKYLNSNTQIWIYRQILREYAVVMTRPENVEYPLNKQEIADDLKKWQKIFNVADETEEVTKELIELIERYDLKGKRIHDANVAATMIVNNISKIYTYNVNDFQKLKEINIIK